MGYHMDLDEYTEQQLLNELSRRHKLRREGKCDYCNRTPDTTSCAHINRHTDPRIAPLHKN